MVGVVKKNAAAETSAGKFQTVPPMTAAQVQNTVFRVDGQELANKVHLPASDFGIAHRSGVGE
jgi:hypothetical protein